jgi:uncharacterized membrane protein
MSSAIEPAKQRGLTGRLRGVLLAAVLIAYPLLVHLTVSARPDSSLGEWLMAAPLIALLVWFLSRSRQGRIGLVALGATAFVGWWAWRAAGVSPAIAYPLTHVSVYLFLLWYFGRTLRPGNEALITRLATYVHGALPDEIRGYTRRVTWAWCLFFGGITLASVLLFALAPLAIWSLFANVLNLPLVAAMYLGEYAYRLLRYPDFSHASIPTVIRAFQRFAGPAQDSARNR